MTENSLNGISVESCRTAADMPCPKRINPDSLTGMIFALEGIRNTIVLLNGPMGCKFYHSTTSQFLSLRPVLTLPAAEEADREGEDPGKHASGEEEGTGKHASGEEEGTGKLASGEKQGTGKRVPVDYNYLNDWFFRQPQVPCTYLDGYDYVYGTAEKVREALEYLKKSVDFELLAIVNSPGASLIGDNLKQIADEILPEKLCVIMESPGYSEEIYDGYSRAGLELVKQVGEKLWKNDDQGRQSENGSRQMNPAERLPGQENPAGLRNPAEWVPGRKQADSHPAPAQPSVNLLGLSIWNRYLEGDREELKRLLALCGIKVNCCLMAENTVEELKAFPQADLNVVIDPLYGAETAKYLEEKLKMPYYICYTLPVGFGATEKMIGEICGKLGIEVTASFTDDIGRARGICYRKIQDIYQMCGLPKGCAFAVDGTPGQVKAYAAFLTGYLGMWQTVPEEAELLFGDANLIAQMKLESPDRAFCGIEISLPGMGYTDIIPKTHFGVRGAMFLTEQVLNGLMSKI